MLQMMEGFDTRTSLLLRGWSATGSATFSTGRISGSAVALNASAGVTYPLTAVAAAIVGFAYQWTSTSSSTTREIVRFQTAAGTLIAALSIIPNAASPYQIQVTDSTGSVLYTSGAIYLPSTWYQFELKVAISGAWELRALGVTVASGSGASFGATNIGAINLGRANISNNVYDDLWVCDTTGSGVNNDFLGDARIQTNFPTGDGGQTQWGLSAGASHFALVDDVPPNDDTDYITDATVGHVDTFTHASLPAGSDVKAVQASLYARKDDVSLRQIAPVIRRAGTNHALTTVTLATGYAGFRQLMETDPISAVAWVDTDINSDEFGVKVIS
jgi:hypothetical protein